MRIAIIGACRGLAKGQGRDFAFVMARREDAADASRALGQSILRERSDRVMLQRQPAIVS
jgi:hypothetical protein